MTEPTKIYEMSPGESVTVQLPHGIGYVEIRTDGVNGATGWPAIGVDAVSRTTNTPAEDGRLYRPYFDHDCGVVLIGEPGLKLAEQERQVEWVETVFAQHNNGDHSDCPDNCPGR